MDYENNFPASKDEEETNDPKEPTASNNVSQDNGNDTPKNVEGIYISSSSNVIISNRDVISIAINANSLEQSRKIVREITEEFASHRIPPPPPADATTQEKVDFWFKYELINEREKLYVVTLSIFNDLKYADFKDIFQLVLNEMAVNGEEQEKRGSRFADPIHAKAKAQIQWDSNRMAQVIQFDNEEFSTAIFDLMCREYQDDLLDLLPVLKRITERYRYWEIRTRAALATVEITKLDFRRVCHDVFDPWARDYRDYVRAAAGYPLARLAENVQFRAEVKTLLDSWTNSHRSNGNNSWRYGWTAASTYKQISFIEENEGWTKQWIETGLEKLAGFDHVAVADAVIHTLVVISLKGGLQDVLHLIKKWIEQGSAGGKNNNEPQIRCIVALLAFMVISNIHIDVEEQCEIENGFKIQNLFKIFVQNEQERGDVWNLILSIGIRAFEFQQHASFLDLVARWTHYAGNDPRQQSTVCSLLEGVYRALPPSTSKRYRPRFSNRLEKWIRHREKDELLAEMALSVKTRLGILP